MTGSSGAIVWLTGRPASGKSTLAERVKTALDRRGIASCVLNSDEVREALANRDYSPAGRDRFYGTLAALAGLLSEQGIIVLVAATAHRAIYRARARQIASHFIEVYVATSARECAKRDPKRLYRDADNGSRAVASLPGMQVPYEVPIHPDIVATGGMDAAAADAIVDRIVELSNETRDRKRQQWR